MFSTWLNHLPGASIVNTSRFQDVFLLTVSPEAVSLIVLEGFPQSCGGQMSHAFGWDGRKVTRRAASEGIENIGTWNVTFPHGTMSVSH